MEKSKKKAPDVSTIKFDNNRSSINLLTMKHPVHM